MRPAERETLRRLYQFRCGYCGISEVDIGAELTVDHFQPRSQGGKHEPGNWVYCCHACNEYKGDLWQPNSLQRILHPLRDGLHAHLVEEEDGTLRGLTTAGRFTIERLRLNRPQLIAYRLECRRQAELRHALAESQRRQVVVIRSMRLLTAKRSPSLVRLTFRQLWQQESRKPSSGWNGESSRSCSSSLRCTERR